MFGSNNDNKDDEQPVAGDQVAPDTSTEEKPAEEKTEDKAPEGDDQSFLPSVPADDNNAVDDSTSMSEEKPAEDKNEEKSEEAAEDTAPVIRPDTSPVVRPSASSGGGGSDDLLQLKREALQQLSPLVGHLEQSPEDRFRTLMMMIQAADDKSLIGDAYEAAQKIEYDKVRAEALLDIVNEINYFTQQDKDVSES